MNPNSQSSSPALTARQHSRQPLVVAFHKVFLKLSLKLYLSMTDQTTPHAPLLKHSQTNTRLPSSTTFIRSQGGGASRNTGAKIAQGDVLFFLDSDDLLPPNTLQKMYRHLISKKCDGVGINTSIKFIGDTIENVQATHTFNRVGEKIQLTDLLQKNGMCSLYSTFMVTRISIYQYRRIPYRTRI